MRVHHLRCGTMCPVAGRLLVNDRGKLVCHCLLVELPDGLLLVDTGLGRDDMSFGARRLGRMFTTLARPTHDTCETAIAHVERLGFSPRDVRHIVLTHLDPDHAGGLGDFPDAVVHVLEDEFEAAMAPSGMRERMRYSAAQLAHGPRWRRYRPGGSGESWFGFACVRELGGVPPEVLLVPLAGHTRGHAGVAVHTGSRWLLHCGDAYFHAREMDVSMPWCPPALRAYQQTMSRHYPAVQENQERLRALVREHGDEVTVFCAHDPAELERAVTAALKRPQPGRA